MGSALAALTACWAAPALASPPSNDVRIEARRLADEAADAYARRDYAHAAVLLERAYSMVPAPTIAVLRARALVELSRWLEAIAAYRSALETRLEPDSPEPFQRAVQEAQSELSALSARVPRVKIAVPQKVLEDARIEVRLDGRVLPRRELGAWTPVDPKTHRLELQREGRVVSAEVFSLGENETRVVALDVPASPSAAPRTWGIAGLAAGGVLLTTGVAAGLIAVDAHEEAKRGCPNGLCPEGSPGAEALERFRTYRTVSTVGYGLGVVAIGAGAAVLITASGDSPARVAIAPAVDGLHVHGWW